MANTVWSQRLAADGPAAAGSSTAAPAGDDQVPLRWSAHLGQLFSDLPLVRRFAAARAAGFGNVEIYSPRGDEVMIADALAAERLDLVGFNLEAGDMTRGERGFVNDPSRRTEALENVAAAIRFGATVRCTNIIVQAGTLHADRPRDIAAVREFLLRALELAEPTGAKLLLEALNPVDVPRYLFNDVDELADFIRDVDHPSLRMLLDVYHVARAGRDSVDAILAHGDLIEHVQIADVPNRSAPGTGQLALAEIFAALRRIAYRGAVGLEYPSARRPPLESLRPLLRG